MENIEKNVELLTFNTEKWYNNEATLGILIFILPPLGIYGVLKNEKIKSAVMKSLIIMFSIAVFYNEIKTIYISTL
jgi:hypothetical protein